MKEFFTRLAYKLSGLKALFTMAVITVLVAHDFTPDNADVLSVLVVSVMGAKALQYGAEAVKEVRRKPDSYEAEGED